MRRLAAFLAAAAPASTAGAFFALALFRLGEEPRARVGGLLFGALYGLCVLGLVRLFRVAPWGLWLVGLVAGPVPAALILPGRGSAEDRAGVWLLTALLGLLIGGIEHARLARDRERT